MINEKTLLVFLFTYILFVSCNTSNKYSITMIDTQLYFSEQLVEFDSIMSLYQCRGRINLKKVDLYLGLNFKIDFDVFQGKGIQLFIPEPGIEGVHISVESIVVTAYFNNDDSINLKNIAFDGNFQYYQVLDCAENRINRSVKQNRLRSLNEDVYILPDSHRTITLENLVDQLNNFPLIAEQEYFLLLDAPLLTQNLDKLTSISITLKFHDSSRLTSEYDLLEKD